MLRAPNRNAYGVLNSYLGAVHLRGFARLPAFQRTGRQRCASACTRASRCRAPTPTRTPSTTPPRSAAGRRHHRPERPGPRRRGEQLQLRPASYRSTATSSSNRPSAPTAPSSTRAASGRDPRWLLHLRQLYLCHRALRDRRHITGYARGDRGGAASYAATEPGAGPADHRARARISRGSTPQRLPGLQRTPAARRLRRTVCQQELTAPPRATPSSCPERSRSAARSRGPSPSARRAAWRCALNASNALNTVQYSGVTPRYQLESHLWAGAPAPPECGRLPITRCTGSRTQLYWPVWASEQRLG